MDNNMPMLVLPGEEETLTAAPAETAPAAASAVQAAPEAAKEEKPMEPSPPRTIP